MKKRSKVIGKKTAAKKVSAPKATTTKKAAKGRTSSASSSRSASRASSSVASGPAKKLLMKLAEDPKIKSAIDMIDHGANNDKITSFRDTLQTFTDMTKSFVGSKRALKIAAYAEVMILAYRLGLVLKTNIFDRPEVKAYIDENLSGLKSSGVYKIAKQFIGNAINQDDVETDAKSKWADSKGSKKTAKSSRVADEESEDDDADMDESDEQAAPKMTRQQRRHQDERKSNMSAMKNQRSSGSNREAKRHPEAAAQANEPHSDFIPGHKGTAPKSSAKNALKS